jgi:nitrate reductase gamma subunit
VNRTEEAAIPPELRDSTSIDPQLVRMLAGLDAEANMEVVQRTRRAVMAVANERRMARAQSQRQIGIILLALGVLVMLLTPAIWVVAEDLFEGEHFQDAPGVAMSLVVTIFSTIFAALIVIWRNRESRSREGL